MNKNARADARTPRATASSAQKPKAACSTAQRPRAHAMDKGSAGASTSSSNGDRDERISAVVTEGQSPVPQSSLRAPSARTSRGTQRHKNIPRSGALGVTAATKCSTAPKPAKTPEADPGTAATPPRHAYLPPGPARRVAPEIENRPRTAQNKKLTAQATRARNRRAAPTRPHVYRV